MADVKTKVPYLGRMVDGTEVGFEAISEAWNEYQLADGSSIRMKLVVTGVVRIDGEKDLFGNQVYLVKSTNVTNVVGQPTVKS